jgi:hypothetical protein
MKLPGVSVGMLRLMSFSCSFCLARCILTASSYLAQKLGRKTFFLISLGLFTLSSLLCGFAPNLNALLLFRILQGVGGGGMVPVAQSILADSFPPEKRGQAFAVFGLAVVETDSRGRSPANRFHHRGDGGGSETMEKPQAAAARGHVFIPVVSWPQNWMTPAREDYLRAHRRIAYDLDHA